MAVVAKTLYVRISVVLLLILVGLGVTQYLLFSVFWQKIIDGSEQRLHWGLAQEIAPALETAIDSGAPYNELLRIAHSVVTLNPQVDLFVLDDRGGVVLNLTAPGVPQQNIGLAPIQQFLAAASDGVVYGDDPVKAGRRTVFSAARLKLRGATGYLYVTIGNAYRRALRTRSVQFSSMSGGAFYFGATIGVAALVGLLVFSYMTKRFHRVTEVVRQYAAGDFSRRLGFERNDEIDELARAVDHMADTIEANTAELERRDERRRELIANVSHDLRGPVTVISGYLDELADGIRSLQSEKHSASLQTIRKSTDSLTNLLSELFELSRLEAHDKKISIEAFSPQQLIEDIVIAHLPKARELGLTLKDDIEEGVPFVFGDVTLIERVLNNLVENSIRYTPEGGAVEIRARREGKDSVRFEVSDTGHGIAAKDLDRVFERFFRSENAAPRTGVSTGLGLAIVQKIVESHGSTIEVRSKEGRGSVFSFCLRTTRNPTLG